MATIGHYGSGPYAVAVDVENHFGTDDHHEQRFDAVEAAVAFYLKHKGTDGPLAGNSPPKWQKTRRNGRLREAMTADVILAALREALGDLASGDDNPTGVEAYHDAGDAAPWRLSDDQHTERYPTPEAAYAGALAWAEQEAAQ